MTRAFAMLILFLLLGRLFADQVEMLNGDRYVGKVVSLNTNTLVFQNEILGTLRLPCSKMARLTFGTNTVANVPQKAPLGPSLATASPTNVLQQLETNTGLIKKVLDQTLGSEGAEARNMYNEMASGLLSGKLTVNDIRLKAKAAADELRQCRRELGEDEGGMLDNYLSILDAFVKETEPTPEKSPKVDSPATN